MCEIIFHHAWHNTVFFFNIVMQSKYLLDWRSVIMSKNASWSVSTLFSSWNCMSGPATWWENDFSGVKIFMNIFKHYREMMFWFVNFGSGLKIKKKSAPLLLILHTKWHINTHKHMKWNDTYIQIQSNNQSNPVTQQPSHHNNTMDLR